MHRSTSGRANVKNNVMRYHWRNVKGNVRWSSTRNVNRSVERNVRRRSTRNARGNVDMNVKRNIKRNVATPILLLHDLCKTLKWPRLHWRDF